MNLVVVAEKVKIQNALDGLKQQATIEPRAALVKSMTKISDASAGMPVGSTPSPANGFDGHSDSGPLFFWQCAELSEQVRRNFNPAEWFRCLR